MDKIPACEAGASGSTPDEGTIHKNSHCWEFLCMVPNGGMFFSRKTTTSLFFQIPHLLLQLQNRLFHIGIRDMGQEKRKDEGSYGDIE